MLLIRKARTKTKPFDLAMGKSLVALLQWKGKKLTKLD